MALMTKQRSVEIFDNTIHSENTLRLYRFNLEKFRKFTGIKDYDSLLGVNPEQLETMLENYIMNLKENLSPNTIPVAFAPIQRFLIANRVNLNFARLRMMFPAKVKKSGNRSWTNKEVQEILAHTTKKRVKALIHLLGSTGCRIGAIDELKFGNVEEMEFGCKAICMYKETKEEYWAFLTPEASTALDNYLKERRTNGETITSESPLFREDYQIARSPAQPMGKQSAQMLLYKCVKKAGGLERKKVGRRYNVQIAHGFRKRFNTILKSNNAVNSNIAEKLMAHKNGLDGVYLTPTREECFKEFIKAIPDLTVDDSERLHVKNKKLEGEKNEMIKQLPNLVNQAVQRIMDTLRSEGCIVDAKNVKIN